MARKRWTPLTWPIAGTVFALVGLVAWSAPVSAGSRIAAATSTPTISIAGLADGTAPFSPADGPGQDANAANGRIRSGDGFVLTASVVPTSSDPVTVDISATSGLVEWADAQPAGCSVGASGVHCDLGARTVGTAIDLALNGTAASRAVPGEVSGQFSVSSGSTPVTKPFTVTAAPPAINASATSPRWLSPSNRNGVDGVLVAYGLHLSAPRTTALIASSAATPWSAVLELTGTGEGSEVVGCSANGDPAGATVFSAAVADAHTEANVDEAARAHGGGAWSCTPDGARVTVAVSGADTNPGQFPSLAWDQSKLAADEGVLSAGTVTVFVPLANMPASATLSVSSVAGSVEGRANHGTCPDLDTVAAGGCGTGTTRTDSLTDTQAGATAPKITVVHRADPSTAAAGSAVDVHYVVTNTGNVALDAVEVEDLDIAGVVANTDGLLQPGQSWSFQRSAVQTETGLASTATATGSAAGSTVSSSHVLTVTLPEAKGPAAAAAAAAAVAAAAVGSAPAGAANDKVTVTVYVNGIEFTALPGPIAIAAAANLVEYEVTNKGAAALTNVVIDDSSITDDATALDCGEDTTTKNRIPSLAGNDTIVCVRTFQPTATPPTVTFTVAATVTGAQDATVNAGFQVKTASVDLQFLVNGLDANTAPGPSVVANSLLTLTYRLSNTGQTDLANVLIIHEEDEDGTFDDITCPTVGDDDDGDASIALLAAGQTVSCTLTPRAVVGSFTTEATATGNAVSPDGEDLVNDEGVIEVTDADPINYTGVSSGTTGGTQPGSGTTVASGTIGQGGANAAPLVVAASGVFLAGFGMWAVSRRTRRRRYSH